MTTNLAGLLIFAADIYAIYNIFSSKKDTGAKILWTLLVLILPLIGLIAWYFAGPKK